MAIDFPSTPFVGQQITESGTTWQWDGISWNIVPVLYAAFASDTPPANPADNQQWWRSTNGQLYFYYNDGNSKQWVQAAGSAGSPGLWEPIGGENGLHKLNAVATYYPIPVNLSPFKMLRVTGSMVMSATAGLAYRASSDGGATFYAGAADYSYQYVMGNVGNVTPSQGVTTVGFFTNTVDAGVWVHFELHINNFNTALDKGGMSLVKERASGSLAVAMFGTAINRPEAMNALQIQATVAATLTGSFTLEGVRG